MKVVGALVSIFCFVVSCQGRFHEGAVKANMTDYVDRSLYEANEYIMALLDPLNIPAATKTFSFKDQGGIEQQGVLDLESGWLQDLPTIYRSGDVTVQNQGGKMLLNSSLSFKDLLFFYDFTANVTNLSDIGLLNGTATGIVVSFSALANMESNNAELQDLAITRIPKSEVEFDGRYTLEDFVIDAMTKVVIEFFDKDVLEAVLTATRKGVEYGFCSIEINNNLARK